MSWIKKSEPPVLEIGPATTPEDVRVQRRLRGQIRPFPLDRIDELSPVSFFSFTPNRRTSRGWEPFKLPGRPESGGNRKQGS